MASSNYPRSRETRNPLVEELQRHQDELDPKHRYLAEAPARDPEGNPAVIRWSRKEKTQYVASEVEGKASGWSAHYEDGRWVVREAKKADKPEKPEKPEKGDKSSKSSKGAKPRTAKARSKK